MKAWLLLLTAILICVFGCSTDSDNPETIFTVPVETNQNYSEKAQSVSTPIQSTVVTATNNTENNKDFTGPKLLESTVQSGEIEPLTEVISLRFNENLAEVDVKLLDSKNSSMGWITSIDIITKRRVILSITTQGIRRRISADRKYYVKGFVKDKHENKTSINIEFRAVEKNRDKWAPSVLSSSIRHKSTNVNINTDQIVFTFNENIKNAESKIVRGKNWNTGQDLKWDRFIDGKRVVLVKITGKSLSLKKSNTYTISIKASDDAGNWTPAPNRVWVYEFNTQR